MNDPGRSMPSHSAPDQQVQARDLAVEIARALDDAKCEDVLALDVRGLSQITDYLIIASGTSDRQIQTAVTKAEDTARERGESAFGGRQDSSSTWQVIDFVTVMVHVFEPATRAMYDLEMFWGDAPHVEWAAGRKPRLGRAR